MSDGIMHIPIFLNTLQAGLYYTKVLVRPLTSPIPYTAPSEDLEITAPDIIAATGTNCNHCRGPHPSLLLWVFFSSQPISQQLL